MAVYSWERSALECGAVSVSRARHTLATVFGEISQQLIHVLVLRPVDEVTASPFLRHQTGVGQILEVKGQGRRRHVQPFLDDTGRKAFTSGDDKRPENFEA